MRSRSATADGEEVVEGAADQVITQTEAVADSELKPGDSETKAGSADEATQGLMEIAK